MSQRRAWLLAMWNRGPLPRHYRWPAVAITSIAVIYVLQQLPDGWRIAFAAVYLVSSIVLVRRLDPPEA